MNCEQCWKQCKEIMKEMEELIEKRHQINKDLKNTADKLWTSVEEDK